MLTITIPANESEQWDEVNEEFVYKTVEKEQVLHLEHSLIALSKWESKWHKPFLTDKELTIDETIDYIKCMTLDKNVNLEVYNRLTQSNIVEIWEYMNDSMTATTFNNVSGNKNNGEQTTSELIYYWMIANNIPVEFEKWHIKRLLTLIRVCGLKNAPPKKMSREAILRQNAELNAARRKQLHSKG